MWRRVRFRSILRSILPFPFRSLGCVVPTAHSTRVEHHGARQAQAREGGDPRVVHTAASASQRPHVLQRQSVRPRHAHLQNARARSKPRERLSARSNRGPRLSSRTRAPSHRRTSRPPRAPRWTTPACSRASRRSARAAAPPSARPPASAGARLPPRRSARPSTRGAGRRKRAKRNRRGGEDPGAEDPAPPEAARSPRCSARSPAPPPRSSVRERLDVQDVQERREPNMNRRASGRAEGASAQPARRVARTLARRSPADGVAAAAIPSMVSGRRGRVEPSSARSYAAESTPVPVPGLGDDAAQRPGVPVDDRRLRDADLAPGARRTRPAPPSASRC